MVSPWQALQMDVNRYGGWSALLREQSLWAVLWYRLGCWLASMPVPWLRRVVLWPWWLVFRFVEMLTGVSLPLGARIGPGLRIWHFGGVIVNSAAVIGANCTLRHGVTIGNRHENGGSPTLGDGVEVGAYAQILGSIRVGNGARIGAMTVVLRDVPDHAVAVGIPAQIRPVGASS